MQLFLRIRRPIHQWSGLLEDSVSSSSAATSPRSAAVRRLHLRPALLLGLCFITSSRALSAEPIPADVIGVYGKSYSVRSASEDCSKRDDESCGLVDAEDEVSISRVSASKVRVRASISADYGHSCEIEGDGSWDRNRLVVKLLPSELEHGVCTVSIEFSPGVMRRLASAPYDACSRYCGARASLDTEGLKRRVDRSSE